MINGKFGKNKVDEVTKLYSKLKSDSEFEFIFFSKGSHALSLEKYIILMKFLSKRTRVDKSIELDDNIVNLDIVCDDEGKNTTYRVTLTNKKLIDEYMQLFNKSNKHVIFNSFVKMSEKISEIETIKKIKNADKTVDVEDLGIRVRLSEELAFSEKDFSKFTNLDESYASKINFRYKERTSFYVINNDNGYVKIDVTVTKTANKFDDLKGTPPRYELEIETKSKKPDDKFLQKMFSETEILLKVIQQSNFIITQSVKNDVVEKYKNLIVPPKQSENNLYGRQPVSLEIQYVGKLADKYAVTDKADGERHFLFITDNNVFLLNKNLDVRDTGIVLKSSKYNNSIVDGELIFLKNRHIFLVFDCLFNCGIDVRKEIKLATRLTYADDIIKNCFVFGEQRGNKFENINFGKTFDLNNHLAFHTKQIKNMFDDLNYDINLEKKYVLIRRKYFIHSLGAKPWEIFAYSSLIWKLYTSDATIKCPYILDGLIYQPNEQAYVINKKESVFDDYKWKPPNKNSIDFYIEFKKDKENNIINVYDNSYGEISDDPNATANGEDRLSDKLYKICKLKVGKVIDGNHDAVLFKENEGLCDAYLLLQDNEARDVEGNIIFDKTVVEFYYDSDSTMSSKFKWIPLRTRYDKTESVIKHKRGYGNFESVAEKVWKSIINPVLMADFDDLAKGNNPEKNLYFYDKKMVAINKRISHDLIVSAAKEDEYHQISEKIAVSMRQFHNFLKSNIIYTYCHAMYRENNKNGKSVLDFGCGEGGDNDKMYYAKVGKYVGIDFSKHSLTNPLRGALSRYERQKRKVGYTDMKFIHGDFTSELDYDNQFKSLGGMDYGNKKLIEEFFSTDPKKRKLFDVINIQFAIHYGFKNDETFKNLKANIRNYLNDNGFVLITTFDGKSIRNLLKGNEKYTQNYTDSDGNVKMLFDIIKKYDDKDPTGTGNAIDVHMAWLFREGVYQTEYLVDDEFMIDEFKRDCDLELVATDIFENQLILYKEFLTKYSQYEADERTRNNLKKFSGIYEKNSINDGSIAYTNLERYYVFRKKAKTIMRGGKLDSTKFVVESVNPYYNEYTFIASIYEILCKHEVIPEGFDDFVYKMEIDLLNDSMLDFDLQKNIAKKIIIKHKDANGKMKVVIDGLHVCIAERDCNDEYVYDMIKLDKPKKKDFVIVLSKNGNVYSPVYTVDSNNVNNGLHNMDDKFIRDIITTINQQ